MKTVKELFGEYSEDTIVGLGWNGREETQLESAARLAASMSLLSELTGLQWWRDTEPLESRTANFVTVPADVTAVEELLREEVRFDWGETAASFSVLLSASNPADGAPALASLHATVGSPIDKWNKVRISLSDDFPLGSPAQATTWFAELVRIWQPDFARLTNIAVLENKVFTRASYISWTSNKAYTEPEGRMDVRFLFGDGTLSVAREWTVEGVTALDRELAAAGAPRLSKRPKKQDTPQFPDELPEGLESLDHEVELAPQGS